MTRDDDTDELLDLGFIILDYKDYQENVSTIRFLHFLQGTVSLIVAEYLKLRVLNPHNVLGGVFSV